MRIKSNYILYSINILTLLLITIIIFVPDNIIRIILGVPVVLFFPGYTLMIALFPRRGSLSDIQRFALSFGMSIAIVPLIGLGLNYTHWGIRLYPMLISLFIFIFIMTVIAWFRKRRLPTEESTNLKVDFKFPSLSHIWSGQLLRDKIIITMLAVIIIGAIGAMVYVINQPRSVEKFTEFYIQNPDGKDENFPQEIFLGQNINITLGIANHEYEPITYMITMTIDGTKSGEIGPINLNNEEKWEEIVSIIPTKTGTNQEIEFLLYKGIDTSVYRRVHFLVNVTK